MQELHIKFDQAALIYTAGSTVHAEGLYHAGTDFPLYYRLRQFIYNCVDKEEEYLIINERELYLFIAWLNFGYSMDHRELQREFIFLKKML